MIRELRQESLIARVEMPGVFMLAAHYVGGPGKETMAEGIQNDDLEWRISKK